MTTTHPRPVRSTRAREPGGAVSNRSTRKPRSTRAQPSTPSATNAQPVVRRSTRADPAKRTPTHPHTAQTTKSTRRVIRTEPVAKPVNRAESAGRKSTRRVIHTEPPDLSRWTQMTEKRQQARYLVPLQFVGVLFGVVVITVFAYGLLGTGEVDTPDEPTSSATETIEVDSTSTNTGILRGD